MIDDILPTPPLILHVDQPVVNSETMQHVCKLKCELKVQMMSYVNSKYGIGA